MRQYRTVQPESLPNPAQPDFHNRLRKMLEDIDWWAQDAAFGFNRIIQGQNPDGSGDPLGGDVDGGIFFRLLGRPNGQIAHFSTGDGGTGILASTTAGVKGKIFLGNAQSSAYDEANNRLGVGTASPSATLHASGSVSNSLVLRPATMATRGAWYTESGDTGGLNEHIDEATADDNDYIFVRVGETDSLAEGQSSAQFLLPTPASTPSASNTHTFRARYRRTGTGGTAGSPPDFGAGPGIDIVLYRYNGGSLVTVASISVTEPEPSGSFTEATDTLSAGDITNCGDYSDLRVYCNWSGSAAGAVDGSQMQVSFVELDCGTATSVTDIFRADDGGIDVSPTIRHNTSWKNILASGSTNDMEQWLANDGTTVMLGVNSSGDIHGGNEAASALNLLSRSATGSPQARVQITSGPDVIFDLPSGSVDPITIGLGLATGSFTGLSLTMALNSTGGNPSTLIVNNDGGSASSVPFIIERHGSQTANLFNMRDDDGTTILSYFDKDGAFNGPIGVVTGLTTFDHILIDNALATDVLLKMTPIVTQSANVMEVHNFASTHIDFTIGPGGLVSVGSYDATDDDVRFQVRAPTSQTTAKNIMQLVRSYNVAGTNLYSAFTVGGTGAVVVGDALTFGAGVIRFRINQGDGQSVDMFQAMNTAGTSSFVTITSAGQLRLSDGVASPNTRTLAFTTASSTAGADLTLDFRSVTDRSLAFDMSGASGTALTTLRFPTTTVARTLTFPNATTTIAGLSVASQVFTRGFTITSILDAVPFTITTDFSGGTTDSIVVTDSTAGDMLTHDSNGLNVTGQYVFWPDGVGVGNGGALRAPVGGFSASQSFIFPNFSGTVSIGGPTTQSTGNQASIGVQNLVSAANVPATSLWMINAYLAVTTADGAGSVATNTVSVSVQWTDVSTVAQTVVLCQRPLTTTGATQGTLFIQVQSSSDIKWLTTMVPFAGAPVEEYAVYIQATLVGD